MRLALRWCRGREGTRGVVPLVEQLEQVELLVVGGGGRWGLNRKYGLLWLTVPPLSANCLVMQLICDAPACD